MTTKQDHIDPEYSREEFTSLSEIIRSIWSQRKIVARISISFVILGFILAFTSGVEYEASSKLMLEAETDLKDNLGALGGLAGLAGISLDLGPSNSIDPEVYPELVKSVPFIVQVLETPIYYKKLDSTVSSSEYFEKYHHESILNTVLKYTVGLPGLIKKNLSNSTNDKVELLEYNTLQFSSDEIDLIEMMQERIQVRVDATTGMINVIVEMPDPFAAAILTEQVVMHLTKQVSRYKTEKAVVNMKFIEERYKESKSEFETKQENLARFTDKNVNLTSALSQAEFQRMQNEYEIAFEVYKGLAIQLEQAKIKVKEDTPIFTPIDPAKVPIEKSKPKRILILSISVLLGLFTAIIFIRARDVIGVSKIG